MLPVVGFYRWNCFCYLLDDERTVSSDVSLFIIITCTYYDVLADQRVAYC